MAGVVIARVFFLLLVVCPLSACAQDDLYICVRVVDGDTVIVRGQDNRLLRVRLIGIDAPESVRPDWPVEYFGKEAAAFTRALAEGKAVRLKYDTQRHDKYDRLLAYVYLPDGRMLNEEMLREGYAHAFTRFPFRYLDKFRRLERKARKEKRGLWREKHERLFHFHDHGAHLWYS